jgi:hypothetical protein
VSVDEITAECVLFVESDGRLTGFHADEGGRARQSLTGRFLGVSEGYRDCERDASWDIVLLCVREVGNPEPLYVLGEVNGGDFMTIRAPARLTWEERSSLSTRLGSLPLSTGLHLQFDCHSLINVDVEDKPLVERQFRDALKSEALVELSSSTVDGSSLSSRLSLSYANAGSLRLGGDVETQPEQ